MQNPNGKHSYRVQSAYDALLLLELVARSPDPVSASQAALLLDEHRNRVFRLLRTLEECGYVTQDPVTHAYQPSLKLVSLAHAVSQHSNVETVLRPVMENLRRETGETVYLVAREGDDTICLINLDSDQMMRISAHPGKHWPLGQGAGGQALLVGMPEPERAAYLARHPMYQPIYERAVRRYMSDGVTFIDGTDHVTDEGVAAIAAPLNVSIGRLPLALAVAWPNTRSTADYERFRDLLCRQIRQLEDGRSNLPARGDSIVMEP